MKVLSRADHVAGVAEHWRQVYQQEDGTWLTWAGMPDKAGGHAAIVAAGADRAAIDAAIGNGSWTVLRCEQCRADCDFLVSVGRCNRADDDGTAVLCLDCVRLAYATLLAATEKRV